jgi:hypothetical protein
LRPLDYLLTAIAGAITLASAFFVYGGVNSEVIIKIHAQEKKVSWEYPLRSDVTLAVEGPLGETIIEMKDGSARIIASPCENKTCISMGAVDRAGQFAACLPNRVIVTIEGSTEGSTKGFAARQKDELDAATW